MDDLAGLVEIQSADIDVSSSVNFSFDWGTIGVIIGSIVGLLVVIFAIAFFCGRGFGFCCDNVCCKGKALVNPNKARKAREQQEIIRAVADGIVGAQNATMTHSQRLRESQYQYRTPSHYSNVSF